LLDIDGTLVEGDRAVPGAIAWLAGLDRRRMPYRLLTNTTRRSRATIAATLARAGFAVDPAHVLTPAALARRRILASGRRSAALIVTDDALADFEGVEAVDDDPAWVVVGDVGEGFTWKVLDRAFGWLLGGARLLALQKNRYWHDGVRIRIDAGPFVAALEFAAEVVAEVVGKPSAEFFELALQDLGLPPSAVVMVGDDIRTDCAGSKAVGCRAALVRTGKFRPDDLRHEPGPDVVLDSVVDLELP
jgi:HAD superfamily hydrolase (TIGR01458 family)